MHADLIGMTVLIVIQSLSLILMLWLSTSLGINPVIQAVEHIKNDQKLPIIGAHEFRYLAGTYNKMYTAYKRSIDNLSFKASHDELTGVYNRAGFDLIRQSVNLETTAFLLFDADKFKNVNDSYGHETGDRILQKLASALKQNFRSDDYVCRIGGDEFLVVMVHVNRNIRRLIEKKSHPDQPAHGKYRGWSSADLRERRSFSLQKRRQSAGNVPGSRHRIILCQGTWKRRLLLL